MDVVGVGARLESQTPDAASPHAAPAAGAAQAPAAAHRVPLLEGVSAGGELGGGKLLIVASIEAAEGRGARHGVSTGDAVAAVENGAAALACVPLLGKATALGSTVWLVLDAGVDMWLVRIVVVEVVVVLLWVVIIMMLL